MFHILSPVIILIPFRGTQFKKKAEQSDGPKTEMTKIIARIILIVINKLSIVPIYSNSLLYQ